MRRETKAIAILLGIALLILLLYILFSLPLIEGGAARG